MAAKKTLSKRVLDSGTEGTDDENKHEEGKAAQAVVKQATEDGRSVPGAEWFAEA